MIGAGERIGNTTPPSIALLAYAVAQTGILLAAGTAGRRLVAPAPRLRLLSRLNRAVMTVYLWHMVPVIIVAVMLYPTGVMPQPRIGTGQWWALRPGWFALLTAVLVPLTLVVMRVQRPLLRLSAGGSEARVRWSPAWLVWGLAATAPALTRLAIGGFAPGGRLPPLALAAYACGLGLMLLSGHSALKLRPPDSV